MATRHLRGLAPLAALALLLAFGGSLAACDAADADASAGAAVASAFTDPTPAQMRAIEALKATWDAAWAAYDAAAFASIYAEDADFVSPIGSILPGREAIRAQHVFLFNGPFAGTTSTSTIRRVVFLTGTIAMVDLDVTLTNFVAVPPDLPQNEPGVVRTRVKWIVVKHGGSWEVVAQQMTARAPGV